MIIPKISKFAFLLVLFLLSKMSWAQSSFRTESTGLKAGAADSEIEIPDGRSLAGYIQRWSFKNWNNDNANYFKPSAGQLDKIRAKTLILKNSSKKMALISVDLVAIPPELRSEVAKEISKYGFSENEFILAATHTHSGPGGYVNNVFWEVLAIDKYDSAFYQEVKVAVISSFVKALLKLRPAKAAVGQKKIRGVTFNRRGLISDDSILTLIRIDSDNKTIATVVNFPVHGTHFSADNLNITSDFPGAIERSLERNVGGVGLFFSDAAGDINPRFNNRDLFELNQLTQSFVEQALPLFRSLRPNSRFAINFTETDVNLERPSLNIWNCLRALNAPTDQRPPNFAEALLKLPDTFKIPLKIKALNLGNHLFIAVPGEPISELGNEARRFSKQAGYNSSSIIGLADSYQGYILSEKEFSRGGYETCNSFYGKSFGDRFLIGVNYLLKRTKLYPK